VREQLSDPSHHATHALHLRNVLDGDSATRVLPPQTLRPLVRSPGADRGSRGGQMSKGRLEAFSDGVLAVAITLLVLDLHVPDPGSGNLGHQLAHMWPSYTAYAISFLTIGIIWINHHAAIARLRAVDHAILVLNLLLLMSICVLPFSTSLFATYLREARGEHLAAAVYGGALLVMGLLFVVLNRHILISKAHLLQPELTEKRRRELLTRNITGILPYFVATAVAFISPYLTLGITAAVAVFYALPATTGLDRQRG
jgi:uncharacterized membrane protein